MKKLLFIFLLLPFIINAQTLQDRAEAIWDFESTNYADSSGNGHTGTATGTVNINSTGGILGNYFETDGTGGDYVDVGAISVGNSWSIGGWVYLDAASDYFLFSRYFGQNGIKTGATGELLYMINNNYYTTGQTVPTGEWFHVMLTYDNSLGSNNATFYYNGTNVDNSNETSTETNPTASWQFGANGNGSYDIDGRLDAWYVFTEVLDATTISDTLYNAGSPTYSYQWTPTTSTGYGWDHQMYSSDLGIGFYPINSTTGNPFKIFVVAVSDTTTPDTTTYDTRIEEINALLGSGFNAYGVTDMGDNDADNNWINGEFYNIGQEGFSNIRLVLYSWDADNATHLSNIAELVDSCNANGMIAIIDYHQPPWLRDSVLSEYETHVDTWLDDWYKTSDYLVNTKGYNSEEVVFELVNEPYNNRTKDGVNQINFDGDTWSNLLAECIDTIRAAVGDSMAIISMPYHGLFNYKRNLDATTFPEDTMLILSMHYYWPNWVTTYDIGTSNHGDWEKIQPFYDVLDRDWDYFKSKGTYPWTVGEWGVYVNQDDSTKAKYINDRERYWDNISVSRSMWDFQWDFGVTTTQGGATFDSDFLNAFKGIPERNFLDYDSTTIYQSDFSSGTDGWTTYTNNGASVSLTNESGKLKCTISNTGSSTLDLRIISPTIPMINDSIYRISFTIAWEDTGDNSRTLAGDMDGSWSWVWYDDVTSTGFTRFEVYYQGYATDNSNNYNFYFGGGETGTFYIEDLKFERIDINY